MTCIFLEPFRTSWWEVSKWVQMLTIPVLCLLKKNNNEHVFSPPQRNFSVFFPIRSFKIWFPLMSKSVFISIVLTFFSPVGFLFTKKWNNYIWLQKLYFLYVLVVLLKNEVPWLWSEMLIWNKFFKMLGFLVLGRLEVNRFPHKNMLRCGGKFFFSLNRFYGNFLTTKTFLFSAVNVTNENFNLQKKKTPFHKGNTKYMQEKCF